MIRVETYSQGRHADILIMYLSSPSSYGIRLRSSPSGIPLGVAGVRTKLTGVSACEPKHITLAEYNELAALRKAQAWRTPMFQPDHPQYAAAMARLSQLEAKELMGCEKIISFPAR